MAGAVAALDYDAELMLRVKHGDAASFSLVLDKHRPPVIHFLMRMVQNHAIPEARSVTPGTSGARSTSRTNRRTCPRGSFPIALPRWSNGYWSTGKLRGYWAARSRP